MRSNLILWPVSAAVSVAVHAGALAGLSYIPMPQPKNAALTELQVGDQRLDSLFQSQAASLAPSVAKRPDTSAQILQSSPPLSQRLAPMSGATVARRKDSASKLAPSPSPGKEKAYSGEPAQPVAALNGSAAPKASATQSMSLAPSDTSQKIDSTNTSTMIPAKPSAPQADARLSPQTGAAPKASATQSASVAPSDTSQKIHSTDTGAMVPAKPSTPQADALLSPEVNAAPTAPAHQEAPLLPPASAPQVDAKDTQATAPAMPSTPRAEAQLSSHPGTAGGKTISASNTNTIISSNAGSPPTVTAAEPSPALSRQTPPESPTVAKTAPQEVASLPADNTVPEVAASTDQASAPETSLPGKPAAPQTPAPPPGKMKQANATAAGSAFLTQADRIRQFLEHDGNRPCVYLKPSMIETGQPTFTGYGGGWERIHQFSEDFRRAVGIDPRLALRPVMDAQCPAVDFIHLLNGVTPSKLTIVIDNQNIANFGYLVGHLEGKLDTNVLLLVIDDDGAVQDISDMWHRGAEHNAFAEQVRLRRNGRSRYQMFLAISSPSPIVSGATRTPGEAPRLFKRLATQISGHNRITAWGIASFQVN